MCFWKDVSRTNFSRTSIVATRCVHISSIKLQIYWFSTHILINFQKVASLDFWTNKIHQDLATTMFLLGCRKNKAKRSHSCRSERRTIMSTFWNAKLMELEVILVCWGRIIWWFFPQIEHECVWWLLSKCICGQLIQMSVTWFPAFWSRGSLLCAMN